MSLRAEINDALDEVTPPAPQLEFWVKGLLDDNARNKKVVARRVGRAQWPRSLRGVVTLVAAALVVVLMGGLILSGRIWRDLHTPPQTINQAELHNLESRPVQQLPVVLPGAMCPTSPLTDTSAHGEARVFGVGPVYATPFQSRAATTNWGTWTVLSLMVDTTKASRLILIRGMDLGTNAMVVFTRAPFHAIDQAGDAIPTGRVMGNQDVGGAREQLYSEQVIVTSRAYPGTKGGDWPIFKGYMGYPKGAMGCIGFQIDGTNIDGTNFTELVIVSA